jgi:hypothetical protein
MDSSGKLPECDPLRCGLTRLREKAALVVSGQRQGVKRLRKNSEWMAKSDENHPSAAIAALILSDLAARMNPCPFKTVPPVEFFRRL